jgi:uncharacterized protein
MLTVSGLYIYPIKSLGGIAVGSAMVTSRGLQHDRRLLLVDDNNIAITQRDFPSMALLQPELLSNGLYVHHTHQAIKPLFVPAQPAGTQNINVTVWEDSCVALLHDSSVNEWFSRVLGSTCRLVWMPEDTLRMVDDRYAHEEEIVSFADAYPLLLIGQSSLDDLNSRLQVPVSMNRFRPNIVFSGGPAFLEDRLHKFSINLIPFRGVKPCARCMVTTINQEDASQSKEPLKTLAGYRRNGNKILFGENLLPDATGIINIGDELVIKSYKTLSTETGR